MTRTIVGVLFFNFIAYLSIGIPLAVLTLYVHLHLGYGAFVAGLVISVQYLATFTSRAPAGRMSDQEGPKQTVLRGLIACAVSGCLLMMAGLVPGSGLLCLTLIMVSRLALGSGESFAATGSTMWGIGRVGTENTARVISWNGVFTFTGLALGAPIGIALEKSIGFYAVGASMLLLALASYPLAVSKPPVAPVPGESIPIRRVFGSVFSCGMGLALSTVGFACIATFITLYYDVNHWPNAALALTAFGVVFVFTRIIFSDGINRFGGYAVASVSLLIELAGLLLLWWAHSHVQAMIGSTITGIGFALIFPSLGVEAVSRVSLSNRGAALGLYSVFTDVALAVTGPVGGYLAREFGFADVFLFAALGAFSALLLTLFLLRRYASRKGESLGLELAPCPPSKS